MFLPCGLILNMLLTSRTAPVEDLRAFPMAGPVYSDVSPITLPGTTNAAGGSFGTSVFQYHDAHKYK